MTLIQDKIRHDVRDGVRAMLPLLVAYAPLGIVVGGRVADSDDPLVAWLSTWVIYGGAAQLAVLDVLAHGSGWVAAATVGVMVNLRLTAYATAMKPDWRGTRLRRRFVAGAILTDAPWALSRARTEGRQGYYLGASGAMLVAWPLLVTAGALLGDRVGRLPLTELLLPLTLGAVIVPQVRDRSTVMAMGIAVACALATLDLSSGAALATIGLAGGAAGALSDRAGKGAS